jgi:DNA-binding NarL/FixJ family response regulator
MGIETQAGNGAPLRQIRVLIVDDYQILADGLNVVMSREPDMAVVGIAGTAAEAVRIAQATRPDVVVMDNQLPDGTGPETAEAIRKSGVEPAFLFLSGDDSDSARIAAAGAAAYLGKGRGVLHVLSAVRRIADPELNPAGDADA